MYFYFGIIACGVQNLLLTLHSKITTGSVQGTIWGIWDQNLVGHMQARALLLAPIGEL